MGGRRHQRVDRLLGRQTELKELEPERSEARIGAMLSRTAPTPALMKWHRLPTAIEDVVIMVPSIPVRAQRPAIE